LVKESGGRPEAHLSDGLKAINPLYLCDSDFELGIPGFMTQTLGFKMFSILLPILDSFLPGPVRYRNTNILPG
jgi:hypothetical protein